jgi:hypothetical protein
MKRNLRFGILLVLTCINAFAVALSAMAAASLSLSTATRR